MKKKSQSSKKAAPSVTMRFLSEYEQGVEDAIRIMWKRATRLGVVSAVYPVHTEEDIRKELFCT